MWILIWRLDEAPLEIVYINTCQGEDVMRYWVKHDICHIIL